MKRASMDPDGWLSRILLCFAATAGIMYVNIMPALVDALQAGLSFSQQQSGRIGSLNTYGGAFGALLMAFMAARLPWRRTLLVLSLLLVVMDYSCLHVTHAGTMMLLRFIHGLFGGSMVGMAFFIVARNLNPSRTFGILMVLQYGLYMVTIEIMPALVRSSGIGALFHFLMVFSGITFLFILAMPEYPLRSVPVAGADRAVVRNLPTMRLLAMLTAQQLGTNFTTIIHLKARTRSGSTQAITILRRKFCIRKICRCGFTGLWIKGRIRLRTSQALSSRRPQATLPFLMN